MPIPILLKILPTGWVGDLLAVLILMGAATVVLESLGIPVIDPAWQWFDATIIQPIEDATIGWFQDKVLP